MATTFNEALKELKKKTEPHPIKRIKLISGEVLDGALTVVNNDMIVVSKTGGGAGTVNYTVRIDSILYISDCELA